MCVCEFVFAEKDERRVNIIKSWSQICIFYHIHKLTCYARHENNNNPPLLFSSYYHHPQHTGMNKKKRENFHYYFTQIVIMLKCNLMSQFWMNMQTELTEQRSTFISMLLWRERERKPFCHYYYDHMKKEARSNVKINDGVLRAGRQRSFSINISTPFSRSLI